MPNLVPLRTTARALPAIVMAADHDARERFLEFFASNLRNRHTRRAYLTAVQDFLDWCEPAGVRLFPRGAAAPCRRLGRAAEPDA